MATSDTGAYILRQLLGDDRLLVIPDMQRDYCWGTPPASRVGTFVNALARMCLEGRPVAMGIVYGYAMPTGSHNMHIIDGQQRLTTLYLLLGMLYRRVPDPTLRRLLISDEQLADDRTPRLVYQERTEAMYFLSDLVVNFFLNRDGRLSQLEQSPWYYRTYDSDSTIRSFIGAIRAIDEALESASQTDGWDFAEMARFVTDSLVFMYYDLGRRARAEKMFITINTTGEPLTRAQGLKAMLYAVSPDREDFARRWEQLERWFWRHRLTDDPQRPVAAGSAIHRFLDIWDAYRRVTKLPEAYTAESIEPLFEFFGAFAALCEAVPEAATLPIDTPDNIMVMLGSIEHMLRWGRLTPRYWNMLRNITRYQRATANGQDALGAIMLVRAMPEADTVSLLKVKGVSPRLLNDEERAKLRALANAGKSRAKTYREIERGQSHPMLNGRMAQVLAWCTDRDGHLDLHRLHRYIDGFYHLWGTDISETADLDHVRRLLLSLNSPDYPMPRRSGLPPTRCIRDYEWQRLMLNSPDLIRKAIDKALQG